VYRKDCVNILDDIIVEQALFKLVYLTVEEAAKKWPMRQRDWAVIYSQLMIFFEYRLGKYV
jgi:putative transposase